ncbi:MAG TPA: response regulator, partial [Acidimicrobiales bacterium]|nr:response regulator [Acidimicrobiales bacterium]
TERALPDTKALLVDASATQRQVLRAQLRTWGVLVDATGDGDVALQHLRRAGRDQDPYDLCIVDTAQYRPDLWLDAGAPGPGARQVVLLVKPGVDPTPLPALSNSVRQLAKPVRQSALYDAIADSASPSPAPLSLPAAATAGPPARRGRVLVVEDNLANQKVARLLLESLGYDAEVADGGAWAIEALARTRFDAVLMDCQMPAMDGYQATAEIRRREGNGRRTPIIAMTAAAMRGDREQCLTSGMDDYVSKPVDPAQLEQVLAHWVGAAPAAGPERVPPGPDQGDGGAFNWERVRALQAMCASGAGPDRWSELVGLFLDDADERVARLRAEAGGDPGSVRELAHGLKGSSANFGATRVRELAAEIERSARDGTCEPVPGLVERLGEAVARARRVLQPGPALALSTGQAG